jgi:(S)-3,5-dihydroxyphenylglycine transaminase
MPMPSPALSAVELARTDLHASLADPSLEAVNFLNEIIDRYPSAISFAPGAPHPGFFDTLDLDGYIDRYTAYLADQQHLTRAQVRRRLFQYGPSRGLIGELIAEALRIDTGIDVSARSIVVTVGCQEAMLLALRALSVGPGDMLAVVTPCYMGIVGAARLLGVPLVSIGEGEAGIDLAQLVQTCKEVRKAGRRVKAVYVAPDFANPSGSFMDRPSRTALLALAAQEDFLILEDSTYGFTAHDDHALPPLKKLDCHRRVVYLGTFSKVCLPGTRVGFVVADQPVHETPPRDRLLADEIAALKTMVTVNTSPICQAVIGGMLLANGGSLAALAKEKATFYRRNLEHLLNALDRRIGRHGGIDWNAPSGGFFVRVRLPAVVNDELVELSARRFGVLWMPMQHFYPEPVESRELRLSCSYLSPEQIEAGVERLAAFVNHVRYR